MTTPNFLDPRLPQRFWDKCIPEPMGGCWLWIATADPKGYGRITMGKPRLAHRVAYEALVGPIASDRPHLDHLCRVSSCVNPAHLEPVTNRENALRGISFSAVNAEKTHCPSGHEYTTENTYVYRGWRYCRICKRAHRKGARMSAA